MGSRFAPMLHKLLLKGLIAALCRKQMVAELWKFAGLSLVDQAPL